MFCWFFSSRLEVGRCEGRGRERRPEFFFSSHLSSLKRHHTFFSSFSLSRIPPSLPPSSSTPCAPPPSRPPAGAQQPSPLLPAAPRPSPRSPPSPPRPRTSAASPTRRSTRPSPSPSARCSTCASRRRPDRFVREDGRTRRSRARKKRERGRVQARLGRRQPRATVVVAAVVVEETSTASSEFSPPDWSFAQGFLSNLHCAGVCLVNAGVASRRKSISKRRSGCILETAMSAFSFFIQPPLVASRLLLLSLARSTPPRRPSSSSLLSSSLLHTARSPPLTFSLSIKN